MSRAEYKEALDYFKQSENPEAVLMVCDSALLRQMCVAWTNTPVRLPKRIVRRPGQKDEHAWWQYLWGVVKYDEADFMSRVPTSDRNLGAKFCALKANRVLYPDATLNSYVARYLQEKVRKQFPSLKALAARVHNE